MRSYPFLLTHVLTFAAAAQGTPASISNSQSSLPGGAAASLDESKCPANGDCTVSTKTLPDDRGTLLNNAGAADGAVTADPAKMVSLAQVSAGGHNNEAGALSPLNYGVKCDGQVYPIMSYPNNTGYLGTLVTGGTDDAAAFKAWLTALASQTKVQGKTKITPVGGSVEGYAEPTFQAVGQLPAGAHCLTSAPVAIPEGVTLEMNGSEFDVTSASSDGIQIIGVQSSGQFVVGAGSKTPLTNAIPARAHDTIHGGRIVYAGPIGQSTGHGLRVSDALTEDISNVTVIGFKTCFSFEAMEYSHADFNQAGNCGTGFKITTGWGTPGGLPVPGGGISIDNQFFGNVSRLNKIDYWLNGAAGNRIYAGTGSFATVATAVFGGNPPNYVSTIAMTLAAGASCPANTNQPITFVDSSGAGSGAEGVVVCNASGTPTGAYSTNGGMNYGLTTTTARVAGVRGVRLTPTVVSTAGMGDFDGPATLNTGENYFSRLDVESEGTDARGFPTGRPATGFQFLFGVNAGGNTVEDIQENVGGSPQEFTRFARDLSGNTFRYNTFGNITDPANTALQCSIETGTSSRTTAFALGGVNINTLACFTNNTAEGQGAYFSAAGTSDAISMTGYIPATWSGGFTATLAKGSNPNFTPLFTVGLDGDSTARGALFANGSFQASGGNRRFDTFWRRAAAGIWTTDGGAIQASGYTATGLTGAGNAYACINAAGQFYRSATACR